MAERPYFLEPGSIREDWRLGVAAFFGSGDGVKAAPGVLSGLAVSQTATASGSVLVSAGWCVNQASSGTGGAHLECLDSQATLDVFGSQPPESSARNDLIVYDSSRAVGQRLRIVRGTASATPTDPAVPAQATTLARIRVKAASAYGASPAIVDNDIDDLRQPTSLRGRAPVVQAFNASGTWQKPPGCVGVRVQVVGGGGAGGGAVSTAANRCSAGAGGGAGGYAESTLAATDVPASVSVTVGAGGAGVPGNAGGSGGASSFGALVSASGGVGGGVATPALNGAGGTPGGVGGTGTAGQVTSSGGGGGASFGVALGAAATTAAFSGAGGSSHFGGGARGVSPAGASIGTAGAVGGGGSGAVNATNTTERAGGDGGRGIVVVHTYF